jgi:N-acetylglucosaminyldiphosphoundecaprenol N-acetyl-beta-D-mannosaminyltransferase
MSESLATLRSTGESFEVLSVRIDAVQVPDVILTMQDWIARRDRCRYIAVTGMHGIVEAQHDAQFQSVLNAANLVVPDGYPLAWLGRRKGFSSLKRRVYGPELMAEFCRQTASRAYRHFFYGGAPGVAEDLANRFALRYPGLQVAGVFCPPFRTLAPQEQRGIATMIEQASPDVVWVGLSTPKQERWMFEQHTQLSVPVLVGVGAAFDFHTERIAQAPRWMRENGLEWFFRLAREPKRLWRRYLIHGSEFVLLVALESIGLRKQL